MRVWATRNTYFPAMRKRYGDTFTVHAAPVGRIVVLCAPEDVRTATMGGPATYPVAEGNALFEPLLGRRSVLGLDGAAHKSERKRMMPALHGERIAKVVSLMGQLTTEEIAGWPVGRTFPIVDRMRDLTLKVIIRVVLGVEERDRADRLVTALRRVVDIRTLDLFMWKWPNLARVGPWRRAVRDLDRADDLLFAEIARRRADPDRQHRPDVLSMLLDGEPGGEPDDDLIRSELVTLLTGGHETTAVATAWMFERLLRNPGALTRVRAGLDQEKDEFRDAVIKETLRLRQVSYNVGRRISEPVELGGYRLPAGTFVWPSLAAIHTDRGAWGEDAEEFRPERWLDGDPPAQAYLPFGGGAHRCLGAMFALTEMDVILRTVLREVDLRAVGDGERGVMRNIILVPKRGARVRVAERHLV
jgi:cytochrome P450